MGFKGESHSKGMIRTFFTERSERETTGAKGGGTPLVTWAGGGRAQKRRRKGPVKKGRERTGSRVCKEKPNSLKILEDLVDQGSLRVR